MTSAGSPVVHNRARETGTQEPESEGRVSARDRLLAERVRSAFWIVLLAFALYAARDVQLMRAELWQLYLIKAIEIAFLVAMRGVLRDPAHWRRAVPIAVVSVSSVYAVTGISAAFRHDITSTPLAFTALTIASAALLPWGAKAQLVSIAVAWLTMLWNVYAVTGGVQALFGYPAVALTVAALASLYVARELEKHRIAVEERTLDLRAREEHFRTLIENATDLISILNPDGTLRYVSPSHERLLGYPAEELIGQNALAFVHPNDVPALVEAIAQGSQGLISNATIPFRFRHKDGSWRLFEGSGRLLPNEPGIVVNSRDITERQRAADALRRSEEHFRSLIEDTADLIAVLETDGTARYISPSVTRILGYRAEEWIGETVFAFIHPVDVEAVRRGFLERVQKPGVGPVIEFRIRHKDGVWHVIEAHANNLLDNPAVAGVVITARDVTERKRTEAEVQKAKEAAEAANRAKGEFLANMSHEIRTPMNGIIGMTDIVLETELTPEQREFLDTVRRSAHSLLGIVNDILDLSKIESGKLALETRDFSLRRSVDEALALLAVRARAKGLDFRVALPADAPEALLGDPGRLRQILTNLVGNAIKFTERGSVTVDAAVDALSAGTACLHFRVTDTGTGIPNEKHALIFQAFEQVDGSPTRQYGGTGLGLAISQSLVEMMGGHIWVESALGRGSTFHFTAWFGLQASEPAPARANVQPGSTLSSPGFADVTDAPADCPAS